MQREREDAEDNYIDMKEQLNVTNVDYSDLAEKMSKMREEIYLLKRQVEEQ